eukprot:scaffold5286_cov160-Ochromonas_danica.AAC.1
MVRADLQANPDVGESINYFLEGMFGEDYSYTLKIDSRKDSELSGTNIFGSYNTTSVLPKDPANQVLQSLFNISSSTIFSAAYTTTTIDRRGLTLRIVTKQTGTTLVKRHQSWNKVTYYDIEYILPDIHNETYNLTLSSPHTVLHNTTSPHAIAAWYGELTESAFQTCTGDAQAQYFAKNHPLPVKTRTNMRTRVVLSVLTAIFLLVPLCYIPAAFVSFLVRERVSKSKHLQQASGVAPMLYWAGTYLWDMSLFSILTGFVLLAFYIVGKSSSSVFVGSAESNLAVFCLVMIYGASAIPLNYLYSFAFTNHSTAQITLTLVNFMTGFVLVLAFFIMHSMSQTVDLSLSLVHIFRFFPGYNLGEGLVNITTCYFEHNLRGRECTPLDWHVAGRNIVFMVLETFGFFASVLLSESKWVRRCWYLYQMETAKRYGKPPSSKAQVDEDVEHERLLVEKYMAVRKRHTQGCL